MLNDEDDSEEVERGLGCQSSDTQNHFHVVSVNISLIPDQKHIVCIPLWHLDEFVKQLLRKHELNLNQSWAVKRGEPLLVLFD